MKKTLLTLSLLAVSSLAAKAVGWGDSYAYSENGATITLTDTPSSFTVVAVVDIEKLQAVMAKDAALTKATLIDAWQVRDDKDNAGAAGVHEIGLQTNYSSYDHDGDSSTAALISTSGIYGCWNQGGAYSFEMNSGFESGAFWSDIKEASVVLTYSYSTGAMGLFTGVKNDGSVVTLGGTFNTTLRGKDMTFDTFKFDTNIVTEAFVFNSVSTVEQATYMGYTVIPEPATATLSLLALAGLAARRRRR